MGFEDNFSGRGLASITKDGFLVSYDAATQTYSIQLPHQTYSPFVSDSEDATFWTSHQPNDGGVLSIFKPSPTNPEMALAYTSYGHGYETHPGLACDYYGNNCVPFVFTDYEEIFAFGVPTPSSGIPVTGTATYDAMVIGKMLRSTYPTQIGGSATLQFNFGSGTLAGHFDPVLVYDDGTTSSLGTYNFVNTVFGVGSTGFFGKLSKEGTASLGSFNGVFTGPAAQELMARWTAPYQTPVGTVYDMYGVWVGKRQ